MSAIPRDAENYWDLSSLFLVRLGSENLFCLFEAKKEIHKDLHPTLYFWKLRFVEYPLLQLKGKGYEWADGAVTFNDAQVPYYILNPLAFQMPTGMATNVIRLKENKTECVFFQKESVYLHNDEQRVYVYKMSLVAEQSSATKAIVPSILESSNSNLLPGESEIRKTDLKNQYHFHLSSLFQESQTLPKHLLQMAVDFAVMKKDTCPISLEPLQKGDIGMTTCGHFFHRKSIFDALCAKEVCPTCRSVCKVADIQLF